MDFPLTLIEPGIGQWRSADIDDDEIPSDLRFHDDITLGVADAVFDARVTRVDKTLDMAFLDLGDRREGMLNFRRARLLVKGGAHSISDCVQEGQMLRVQTVAEPSASENKAAPLTPRPRLAGRYVVIETGAPRLNLSKDLTARRTKELKELLAPEVSGAAVIVRSRAQDVPVEAVLSETKRLHAALTTAMLPEPGLVFAWTPAEQAVLSAPSGDTPILVEGGSAFAETKRQTKCWPDLHARLHPYSGENGFEEFGVNEAIEEALAPRIDLPSGGWISITPTPALTAVDVNMGSALQHMAAGEAKLAVNMEATLALMHHLRFQDIGGIIVVDYLSMSGKGSTRNLMKLIEDCCRRDVVPVQHTGISAFGLVEFTRKRSSLSLRDRMMTQPAPVERTSALAADLLRRGAQAGKGAAAGALNLEAPRPVVQWLEARPGLVDALRVATNRELVFTEKSALGAYIG